MDLKHLENVKAQYDKLTPAERLEMAPKIAHIKGCIDRDLPCLNDLDKAAVADYIAGLVGVLQRQPLQGIDDLLFSTIIAYGVGAVEYLGWNQAPEIGGPDVAPAA